MEIPESFKKFCKEQNIKIENYEKKIPRVIRLKMNENYIKTLELAQKQLKTEFKPIEFLPKGFFEIDSDIKISKNEFYENGLLYGIDSSSALSVMALDPKENETFLDICCAPGAKLSFLADYLTDYIKTKNFRIVGIDNSKNRLAICRNIIEKYNIPNVRLILGDGTNFNNNIKRKKLKNLKENKEEHVLFYQTGIWYGEYLQNVKKKRKIDDDEVFEFDKIMVDAECSTDGSVRHIHHLDQEGWRNFEKIYGDENRLKDISNLQKQLLHSGFKLLKKGGILVYSTCSFMRSENEDVITWLLNQEKSAKVIPSNIDKNVKYTQGHIEYSYRFDPIISNTSGFFLCSITKL